LDEGSTIRIARGTYHKTSYTGGNAALPITAAARMTGPPDSKSSAPGATRGQTIPTLPELLGRNLVRDAGVDRMRAAFKLRLRLARSIGVGPTLELIAERLRHRPLPWFADVAPRFVGKKLLEVGGPSKPFLTMIPVYGRSTRVDNVEWRAWSDHRVTDSATADPTPARSFVGEATDLSMLPSGSYDTMVSSHVLEHVANPIKALHEWRRVLRKGGTLLAIVPRRELGFDHLRPPTTFDHIEADFRNQTTEDDRTHLEEVLQLHDVSLDAGAWPLDQYRYRVNHNLYYRVIHHHIFETATLKQTVEAGGFDVDLFAVSAVLGSIVIATAREEISKARGHTG
jgi:SAM-dependent methyltransferase